MVQKMEDIIKGDRLRSSKLCTRLSVDSGWVKAASTSKTCRNFGGMSNHCTHPVGLKTLWQAISSFGHVMTKRSLLRRQPSCMIGACSISGLMGFLGGSIIFASPDDAGLMAWARVRAMVSHGAKHNASILCNAKRWMADETPPNLACATTTECRPCLSHQHCNQLV